MKRMNLSIEVIVPQKTNQKIKIIQNANTLHHNHRIIKQTRLQYLRSNILIKTKMSNL
jgi:hypothetical protein